MLAFRIPWRDHMLAVKLDVRDHDGGLQRPWLNPSDRACHNQPLDQRSALIILWSRSARSPF